MRHFSNFWNKYRYFKVNLSNGMEVEDTNKLLRVPSLLLIPLMICVALLYFVDVFQIRYYSIVVPTPPKSRLQEGGGVRMYDRSLIGYTINTPGCRIPEMDPFDSTVEEFIVRPSNTICNNGTPPLIKADRQGVYLVEANMAAYNLSQADEMVCCYRSFWRLPPKKQQRDNKFTFNETCTIFNESAKIPHEFIEVTCKRNNTIIYKDMFAFVPLKDTISYKISTPKPLNVLILGYDAVSRVNLHRQMPKTVRTLKELGAVELLGYNKVADNTFPNLIPVLAGVSESELKEKCWPRQQSYFDGCHFIWHDFKKLGFVTAFGEDSSWMGLFNYQRSGFKNQTVDYAYNYFNRISESAIGNAHSMNVEECIGAEMTYKKQLDYAKSFVSTMDENDLPYFGFFWGVSLSHDYLNKPKLGDDVYKELFEWLKNEGHLNNTVLVFMSDHGIRWGGIRQTFQGRLEERLPFVMMVLPEWYKQRFPAASKNLQRNSRRLTTPYDLHSTLVDLLFPYTLTEDYLEISDTKSRGISLFREISKERTCVNAGIDDHWCTCQSSVEISTTSNEAEKAAKFAVNYINGELKGYAQCAVLKLDSILNARRMFQQGDIADGKDKTQDYTLTLKTLPGEGIFEMTVRLNLKKKEYELTGTVSRLNLYGTQSSCITDFHLKLYCYCKSILE